MTRTLRNRILLAALATALVIIAVVAIVHRNRGAVHAGADRAEATVSTIILDRNVAVAIQDERWATVADIDVAAARAATDRALASFPTAVANPDSDADLTGTDDVAATITEAREALADGTEVGRADGLALFDEVLEMLVDRSAVIEPDLLPDATSARLATTGGSLLQFRRDVDAELEIVLNAAAAGEAAPNEVAGLADARSATTQWLDTLQLTTPAALQPRLDRVIDPDLLRDLRSIEDGVLAGAPAEQISMVRADRLGAAAGLVELSQSGLSAGLADDADGAKRQQNLALAGGGLGLLFLLGFGWSIAAERTEDDVDAAPASNPSAPSSAPPSSALSASITTAPAESGEGFGDDAVERGVSVFADEPDDWPADGHRVLGGATAPTFADADDADAGADAEAAPALAADTESEADLGGAEQSGAEESDADAVDADQDDADQGDADENEAAAAAAEDSVVAYLRINAEPPNRSKPVTRVSIAGDEPDDPESLSVEFIGGDTDADDAPAIESVDDFVVHADALLSRQQARVDELRDLVDADAIEKVDELDGLTGELRGAVADLRPLAESVNPAATAEQLDETIAAARSPRDFARRVRRTEEYPDPLVGLEHTLLSHRLGQPRNRFAESRADFADRVVSEPIASAASDDVDPHSDLFDIDPVPAGDTPLDGDWPAAGAPAVRRRSMFAVDTSTARPDRPAPRGESLFRRFRGSVGAALSDVRDDSRTPEGDDSADDQSENGA